MKARIYKSGDRGYVNHGWLKTHHTFSFAEYYNPEFMRFGKLRVINDDTIAPKMGFGLHHHDNMEIITVPINGILAHTDSEGHKEIIKPDEIQIMSAGHSIMHSEFNASDTEFVNLLQIWILPKIHNIEPRYDQKIFPAEERKNKLQKLVSPVNSPDTLWINQDAYISRIMLEKENAIDYLLNDPQNGLFAFIISGNALFGEWELNERDGIGISEFELVNIRSLTDSEILFLEIPMN